MKNVGGDAFFAKVKNKIKNYPGLDKNIQTDVLIVGGGINGALLNFYLSQDYDCVLVEKNRIGQNLTARTAAMLEYQLDNFAEELVQSMKEEEIVDVYQMAQFSIKRIHDFLEKYGNKCEFARRPTMIYAKKGDNVSKFKREFGFRISNGFECDMFDNSDEKFPFEIKTSIYAENGGAEVNPYLLTKQYIDNSKNQENIYENTEIVHFNDSDDDEKKIVATAQNGHTITCKKIVLATGYEYAFMKESYMGERFVSYSIVTNPLPEFSWHSNTLIQDSKKPYHYMRILPDNRIILGGEDTKFRGKSISEKKVKKKYERLLKFLITLFPELENVARIEYSFWGFLSETKNNLGIIGKTRHPNVLYFISGGANGIVNAVYGVEIIRDCIENRHNQLEDVFSPMRMVDK